MFMRVKLPAGMSRFSYAEAHTAKSQPSGDKSSRNTSKPFPPTSPIVPLFWVIIIYHGSLIQDMSSLPIVRTMDLDAHKPLADLGKAKAIGSNNRNQWTELRALDDDP